MTETKTDTKQSWIAAAITILVVAIAVVVAFIGSGAMGGTEISEAAGGWLSADATPIAPGGTAFSIWSVIYVGLAGYALWQLSPTARKSERQRKIRPWAIASALLNALWIWTVQWEVLLASVIVILVLLAVLIRIMLLITASSPANWVEAIFNDVTFGLYLGWVTVATLANITSWLGAAGLAGFDQWLPTAIALVVVAGLVGIGTAVYNGGKLAPAAATAWGLSWIAVARTEGQFEAPALVWVAAIAAAAILIAAVLIRLRSNTRRNAPHGEPNRGSAAL